MVGQTISHYRILDKLGEGGMGVVYKAEDTQLRRTVALKFLSSETVGDEEVKARLIREAQASASLDHANICQVFGIHEEQGETFIAMAYIDGPSLGDKIKERPLPLEEALDIAIQIAAGLQEAHEKGIVHRDIKPHNIMLTAKGQVKIMDFGLAAVTGRSRLTKSGTTLGTPAYMAPEQLEGREVDRRADIWALGCVLYEMLTRRTPFDADYEQAIAYGILNEPPEPVTALRSGMSVEVDRVVSRALVKDPAQRYQHSDELLVDLRRLRSELAATEKPALAQKQQAIPTARSEEMVPRQKLRFYQALLGVTTALALALAFIYSSEPPPQSSEPPLRRFAFKPATDVGATPWNTSAAISPNGKHIAFTTGGASTFSGADAGGKLWIQDLDQREPRAIEGTEGAISPFWSVGSDSIGFAAGSEIKKVSSQGGSVVRLCSMPASNFFGGTWSPDGEVIVFASGTGPYGLYEVSARGGAPNLLTSSLDGLEGPTGIIAWPHFLPSKTGARVLVFTVRAWGEPEMVLYDLNEGLREPLGPGTFPFYSPTGHLIHQPSFSTNELWALPFSADTLKTGGGAFPISENSRQPTVASDGTLVYLEASGTGREQLVWLDRDGNKTGEIGEAQHDSVDPALSPNGRFVAVAAKEGANHDVWVWDIARSVRSRLSTSSGADYRTVWSPNSERVAFSSVSGGNWGIFVQQADGSGEATVVLATQQEEWVSDWSSDGKYILYERGERETADDLWYLERDEDGRGWSQHPLLQTPFSERTAKLSPDGRHVAYSSNESGQYEVYVAPFPAGGPKLTVSKHGGQQPRWSRDGKELFFVDGRALVALSISTESTLSAGSTSRLFEHPSLTRSFYPQFDVSGDGQRFVVAELIEGSEPLIQVVQNWHEAFRDRERD